MTRDEVLADLAYARTLAEEGRHAPLIGGAYFVLFGVLLAVCYVAQWAVLSQTLAIPQSMVGAIWFAFGIAAPVGSYVLSRRVRMLPGCAAIPNRLDRHIWQAVTFAILTVVAATVARVVVFADYAAPDAIVAAGFGIYGVALYTTATVGGHAWLKTFAFLAWLVSGALWFFLHEPWTYLLAAAASIVVLLIPGLIMLQREPKTIV